MNAVSQKLIEQVNNLPVKQGKSKASGVESFIQVFKDIAGESKGSEEKLSKEENSINSVLDDDLPAAANLLNTFWNFQLIRETDTPASSLQIPKAETLAMLQQKIVAEGTVQYPQELNNEVMFSAIEGETAEPVKAGELIFKDLSKQVEISQKGSIRGEENLLDHVSIKKADNMPRAQNKDLMFSAVKDKPVEQSIQEYASNAKNGAAETSALMQSAIQQKESIPVRELPEKLVSIIQANINTGVKPELLQIKLEPEHLGEFAVKLAYKQGEVSAQFIAGSAQAKEVLESTMVRMKEALARHQINLKGSSVSVVDKGRQMPKFENLPMLQQKIAAAGTVQYPQRQNNEPMFSAIAGEPVEPVKAGELIFKDSSQEAAIFQKGSLGERQYNDLMSSAVKDKPVEQITQENVSNSKNGAAEITALRQSDIQQKEGISVRELPEKLVSILQSNTKSGEKPVLVQIKLEPEHLGELVIKLAYKKGEISAQFITGSVQAKEVLESSMTQLREALAQHQVHLQESSVSVAYSGGQFMQQQHGKPGSRKYLQLFNGSNKGEETPLYEQVKPQPGGVDYLI